MIFANPNLCSCQEKKGKKKLFQPVGYQNQGWLYPISQQTSSGSHWGWSRQEQQGGQPFLTTWVHSGPDKLPKHQKGKELHKILPGRWRTMFMYFMSMAQSHIGNFFFPTLLRTGLWDKPLYPEKKGDPDLLTLKGLQDGQGWVPPWRKQSKHIRGWKKGKDLFFQGPPMDFSILCIQVVYKV